MLQQYCVISNLQAGATSVWLG